MKIYHTETQADYDALMAELEEQGCKWLTGDRPTKTTYWHLNREKTCVNVQSEGEMRITSKEYHSLFHPEVLITKYKAKADEKMRFTKENVYKLIIEYRKDGNYTLNDLQDKILNLDDAAEKVVVPKFVAEWYESQTNYNIHRMIEILLNGSDLEEMVLIWLRGNFPKYGLIDRFDLLALIRVHGYTIEKEPQYMVSIMDLGIDRIILMKNRLGYSFELESENDGHWEVHFTEQQIKEYDKRYWAFAIPVEGENEL